MIIYIVGTILISTFMSGCDSAYVKEDLEAAIQVDRNKINSTANNEDDAPSQKKLRRKNAIRRNNKSDYESTSDDSTTLDTSEDKLSN